MARMFPDKLPTFVRSDAERLLYHEFAQQLPDDFLVLYSVGFHLVHRDRLDQFGEADFVIIHRDLGLLLLEVKGGQIRADGQTGQWYSRDARGQDHPIKNPFAQARENLFMLREKLDEAPKTRPFRYRIECGVAFPEIVAGDVYLGPDADRGALIDSTDLHQLERAVRRILGQPDRRLRLSDEALDALVQVLRPSFELTRLGLGGRVRASEREIIRLTEQQVRVLNYLQLHRRAAISGCAGSGKTMVAVEKARQLARQGYRVLFTCFNANLAHWVRGRLEEDGLAGHVQVAHYHGLVRETCQQCGIDLPPAPSGSAPQDERNRYYGEVMPEKLLEALRSHRDRFDAVVVDEGQDFHELWWYTLIDFLAEPEQGIFYIFFDNNQRIYTDTDAIPFSVAPFTLDLNCRNTVRIHAQVVRYYQGSPVPQSQGPDGVPPQVIRVEPGAEIDALRDVLHILITDERIPIHHVVILTPVRRSSVFREGTRVGNVTLTWSTEPEPNQVQVSTIHSFKGLESPIVILAELHKLPRGGRRDYLLYTGISRARTHLIVLGRLPDPAREPEPLRTDAHGWMDELDDVGGGDLRFTASRLLEEDA